MVNFLFFLPSLSYSLLHWTLRFSLSRSLFITFAFFTRTHTQNIYNTYTNMVLAHHRITRLVPNNKKKSFYTVKSIILFYRSRLHHTHTHIYTYIYIYIDDNDDGNLLFSSFFSLKFPLIFFFFLTFF